MLNNLLLNGGRVLIIGGMAKAWESYRQIPQLEFWSGEQKDIHRALRNKEIPANCKAIVISRFISHAELAKVMQQARNRGITMFPNKNDGEVANILDEMTMHLRNGAKLTVTDAPPRETPVDSVDTRQLPELTTTPTKIPERGKMALLNPFIDLDKGNTENARILIKKAAELGFTTTEASIAQHVGVYRRKIGAKPSPLSRQTHPTGTIRTQTEKAPVAAIERVTDKIIDERVDLSVKMLDSMIQDLQGMRDFLIAITEENNALKAKMAKLKQVFE